jgi:succinyl-diaminopimelate desuccinylase
MNGRFNDLWTRESLRAEIERRLRAAAENAPKDLVGESPIRWSLVEEPATSDVFLTRDQDLIDQLSAAITAVTGRSPALSTGGGTSDARFIKEYCPVVEFGPVGTTMHAIDERISLSELDQTSQIYEAFLDAYFPSK